ncbi:hypothetical protein HZB96_05820 [Candidatus Gottesmanbacteria bacterium]|nr:hypothetical protein [Candidatus Gottesmanbacteria bacterium]
MKILVFTEGTVIMHRNAKGVSREEAVRQSRLAGIQQEERTLSYDTKSQLSIEAGSPHDSKNYIPVGNAVTKLKLWKNQGATILYLTSRRINNEVEVIRNILKKYDFPHADNLYFRQLGEDYKDVAERLLPDVIVEDDCESIGGEIEMTYPHIRPDLKKKIKSVIVKEFCGIDQLPDNVSELLTL